MSRMQAEIGIMIGILVGAWIVKVVSVTLYIFFSRRRSAQRHNSLQVPAELANSTRSSGPHKPAPAHAIAALPVCSYAKLRLRHGGRQPGSSAAADACKAPHSQQSRSRRRLSLDAVPQRDQSRRQQWRRSSADAGGCGTGASQQPSGSSTTSSSETAATAADTPEEEADTCAICFCEYEAADLVKQMRCCAHFYHKECIDLWLHKDNSCPLCKRPAWLATPSEAPAAGDANPDSNGAEVDDTSATATTTTQQHVVVVVVGLPAAPATTGSSTGPAAVAAQQV